MHNTATGEFFILTNKRSSFDHLTCLSFFHISSKMKKKWSHGGTEARRKVMKENDIGNIVVETAITIHRELGPGLLESVYEEIMAYELRKIGLMVKQQANIPIKYKSITLDKAFQIGRAHV